MTSDDRPLLFLPAAAAVAAPVLPFAFAASAAPGLAAFILVAGLVIATLHVALLFVPAWILISRRTRLPWPGTALLGLVCGALPSLLFLPNAAWMFGMCGLVGGIAFHATYHRHSLPDA